jgi:transcriptional regulator with XRE-family HTH domain
MGDRSPDYLALGQAVKELREAHELTEEELARATGLDVDFIVACEEGEANPTFGDLLRMSAGFDEPLMELMFCYEQRLASLLS